jgi:predicted nucleic acid-binding protein
MANKIVLSDSGPIIHLAELDAEQTWELFNAVWVPDVIIGEVTLKKLPGSDTVSNQRFKENITTNCLKKLASQLISKHIMGENDGLVLAHAVILKADLLLTDDLELRNAAIKEAIRPVGTMGLLLRAYREDLFTFYKLMSILNAIMETSSLYITMDIIDLIKNQAERFEHAK